MANYTRGGKAKVHAYSHANLTACYKAITTMATTDAPVTCAACAKAA